MPNEISCIFISIVSYFTILYYLSHLRLVSRNFFNHQAATNLFTNKKKKRRKKLLITNHQSPIPTLYPGSSSHQNPVSMFLNGNFSATSLTKLIIHTRTQPRTRTNTLTPPETPLTTPRSLFINLYCKLYVIQNRDYYYIMYITIYHIIYFTNPLVTALTVTRTAFLLDYC